MVGNGDKLYWKLMADTNQCGLQLMNGSSFIKTLESAPVSTDFGT